MEDEPKENDERPKRRVRRYSPDRLLRQPVALSGGATVSVEKHRGRKMVRVDEPGESGAGDNAIRGQ
jgi:hypothetical protein